jgi:effector-binding domain-containing protein
MENKNKDNIYTHTAMQIEEIRLTAIRKFDSDPNNTQKSKAEIFSHLLLTYDHEIIPYFTQVLMNARAESRDNKIRIYGVLRNMMNITADLLFNELDIWKDELTTDDEKRQS